jgi:hypothetical protein
MGLTLAKMYNNAMDKYDKIHIECYNTHYTLRKVPGSQLDINNKYGLQFIECAGKELIIIRYSETKIIYLNVEGDTVNISFMRSPIQADSITTTEIYWNSDMKKIVIKDAD